MRISATSAAPVESRPVPRANLTAPQAVRHVARWVPLLTGVLTFLAALHAIEPLPVGVFYDDAQYLVLAKSIASGSGYRFLNLPGAPLATHFPPGYPAFLALLWRIAPSFPENVALFKLANAVLLAIVGVLACQLARRTLALPRTIASAAALAGTATIPSLVLSSSIMSEPLFLALLIPIFIWSENATRRVDDRDAQSSPWPAVFLGVAIGGVTLVRSHGIALGAAVLTTYLLRGRRRDAAVCMVAMAVTLAPWAMWVTAHNETLPPLLRGAYGSYVGWLAAGWSSEGMRLLGVTLADNVATLWMTIVRSVVPSDWPFVDAFVGGVYIVLAAIGVERCWTHARVLTLFLGFYVAIVLIWPFSPLRFVWGIWPLLMMLPAVGLTAAWNSELVRRRAAARTALILSAGALAAGIVAFNARGYANAWWSSNARFHARRVLPQLAWVAKSTRPGDLIASDAEAAVYLYTGRTVIPATTFTAVEYLRERTVAEETHVIDQLLRRYRPRYIVVTSPHLIEAVERLKQVPPNRLAKIDSLGDAAGYAFLDCSTLAANMLPERCRR